MIMEIPKKPANQPKPAFPTYRSEELFAKGTVVIILHGDRQYQLRITSANKLILTA